MILLVDVDVDVDIGDLDGIVRQEEVVFNDKLT